MSCRAIPPACWGYMQHCTGHGCLILAIVRPRMKECGFWLHIIITQAQAHNHKPCPGIVFCAHVCSPLHTCVWSALFPQCAPVFLLVPGPSWVLVLLIPYESAVEQERPSFETPT